MEIELRKWTMADKKILAELCSNVNRQYLSERLPFPYTEEDGEWWLNMADQREGTEGIFRAVLADGQFVGNISVERKSDVYRKDAEIGYMLATDWWSKGLMTEAVQQICQIAFSELDIVRITGLVYKKNAASQKVLEKNGFVLEGVMKQAVYKNEKLDDLHIYGKYR